MFPTFIELGDIWLYIKSYGYLQEVFDAGVSLLSIPVNGPIINRQPVNVANVPPATVKVVRHFFSFLILMEKTRAL